MSAQNEEPQAETEGAEIQATIELSPASRREQQQQEKSSENEIVRGMLRRGLDKPAGKEVKQWTREVVGVEKTAAGEEVTAAAAVASSSSSNNSSSSGSNNDICRICHMGNTISRQSCLISGERTSSANLDLGLLVSACRCRGTVGLVHTKCLERWLTESGHTRCELCGYRYATVRVPRHGVLRSLLIWIKTFVATRQMLLDSLYLVVTTPLAVFSAYVCAMTLKMALENRVSDIPWTIVAMLPTCSLTLVAYWGWLLTLQRLHGRRWRRYWQSNFIVQLIPDRPVPTAGSPSGEDVVARINQEEVLFEDLPDGFNVI